jgi:hypothetical protein
MVLRTSAYSSSDAMLAFRPFLSPKYLVLRMPGRPNHLQKHEVSCMADLTLLHEVHLENATAQSVVLLLLSTPSR